MLPLTKCPGRIERRPSSCAFSITGAQKAQLRGRDIQGGTKREKEKRWIYVRSYWQVSVAEWRTTNPPSDSAIATLSRRRRALHSHTENGKSGERVPNLIGVAADFAADHDRIHWRNGKKGRSLRVAGSAFLANHGAIATQRDATATAIVRLLEIDSAEDRRENVPRSIRDRVAAMLLATRIRARTCKGAIARARQSIAG